MNQETKIQNAIHLTLSEAGCLIWRNETGNFWAGKVIHKERDTVTLSGARMVQAGLCKGSADLIGITPGGRFIAVEIKTPQGRATAEQLRFIDAVRASGGIAGICRSPKEALTLLFENE